jgi:heme peroxidase
MPRAERRAWPPLGDVLAGLVAPIAEKLDRVAGWDRLPRYLGIITLLGLRHRLRERNLYDTGRAPSQTEGPRGQRPAARTLDGSGNDPVDPWMGAVGTRFGRNAPPVLEDEVALGSPPALEVSRRLLTRDEFLPAETLNLLAAAWIQFEVHDWFAHQIDRDDPAFIARSRSMPVDVPSEPAPFRRDTTVEGDYPAFMTDQTHWWDASQLYGASADFADAIRDGDEGKVKVDDELLAAMEPFTSRRAAASPPVPNLWIGSALLHILFAKEHNAICDRLHEEFPTWDGDRLYAKARLINAAVMAKIHTVEWTPAIIAHPATTSAIRATWWGVLGKDHRRRFGRLGSGEILNGIPGSRLSHDGVPYALTEEFVTVYRLHPLIPDSVTFHRAADHATMDTWDFADLAVARDRPGQPRARLQAIEPADAFYSLGIAHPGAITLHNYPRFLQEFKRIDEPGVRNLGAIDILRTRETGVPRYNNFRRLFRLRPAASFEEIANGNPRWAEEIREVYEGELERVDLLIGMFAERKPEGFAFSDTAFRVFLLMAARRLRSDRFFTTDYTPDVYTRVGLRWIDDATLAAVLRRHYPELGAALSSVANPFQPWRSPHPVS